MGYSPQLRGSLQYWCQSTTTNVSEGFNFISTTGDPSHMPFKAGLQIPHAGEPEVWTIRPASRVTGKIKHPSGSS
jgi:hypothetical protein